MFIRHLTPASDPDRDLWSDGARCAWSAGSARCAVWTSSTASLNGSPIGVIGRFSATRADEAAAVLSQACRFLADHGFRTAVGPMDGSTWRSYRLVTESDGSPPFAGEPANPDQWPGMWVSAGFAPLATYHSSRTESSAPSEDELQATSARARSAGLRVRAIDTSRLSAELDALGTLCLEAFADNFLYTPIARAEFVARFAPLLQRVDPQLLFMVDDPDRPGTLAAALLTYPHAPGGSSTPALVLKTIAVAPRWRGLGLAGWLCDLARARGETMGLRSAIFALMHDDNPSARISRRSARVFRRYTILSRSLSG